MHILISSLLAAALGGCFYTRNVGVPADADTIDAAHADAATSPPTPVTFRFGYKFSGGFAPPTQPCSNQVFLQTEGDQGFQGFVTVIDSTGQPFPITPDCRLCFCPTEPGVHACDHAAVPAVTKLMYGGSVDVVWDGTSWPTVFDCAPMNRSCQGASSAPSGPYLARFCYATTSDGVGVNHHVGATTCEDVPFEYPVASGVVEHDAICFAP